MAHCQINKRETTYAAEPVRINLIIPVPTYMQIHKAKKATRVRFRIAKLSSSFKKTKEKLNEGPCSSFFNQLRKPSDIQSYRTLVKERHPCCHYKLVFCEELMIIGCH